MTDKEEFIKKLKGDIQAKINHFKKEHDKYLKWWDEAEQTNSETAKYYMEKMQECDARIAAYNDVYILLLK